MLIFYIDDDDDDRDLFMDALDTVCLEATCLTARDGEQALKILKERIVLPDLIFLDVNMPVMGGREFLRMLKADSRLRDIPVVIYSTTSSAAEWEEFRRLGATLCLRKQWGFKKLCEDLVEAIEPFKV